MSITLPALSRLLLTLLPALLSFSAQGATTQVLFTLGKATEAASGEHLYTEVYLCTPDQSRCTVEYRDVQDEVFARKTLDYRERLHAPAVVMRDLRVGTAQELPVHSDPEVVVDAGFDNFVRLRWDELQRNEEVTFPLQLMTLERPIRMRARAYQAECDRDQLCVRVEVNSWLLGLVADPILLRYSRADQRLVYFSGLSNIKTAEGDSQVVEIHYEYAVREGSGVSTGGSSL